MKLTEFTHLLIHPNSITTEQTQQIEIVLKEFPYLQPARAIYLKGLYDQKSYKYNTDLKITAAYTTDRSILFNFITSTKFKSILEIIKTDFDKADEIIVNEFEIVNKNSELNTVEVSIKKSIQQAANKNIHVEKDENLADIYTNNLVENKDNTININETELNNVQPIIDFNSNESHSFSQWLQLTKLQPINRDEEQSTENLNTILDVERQNKFKLIDEFIEKNPKIVAVKNAAVNSINIEKSTEEKSYLMTETLAKVYLQQKKFQKALQAYEILILKYPEKSSLFAERIVEIKKIQNNNN